MTTQHHLAREVRQLLQDLPAEWVDQLAGALAGGHPGDWHHLATRALGPIPQPDMRERVESFLYAWRTHFPDVAPDAVSLALLAACEALEYQHQAQRLELVWTGPDSRVIPLRRTDQALLQVIDEARETLHVVSFAVYRVEAIARALVRAARRGVAIAVYLETPDASEGRIAFDTIGALGRDVVEYARIYVWPLEKRLRTADGRHGSLHAKVALADGKTMLVSSANLTEYAMTLNMEMGLLVHGGPLPAQMEAHLRRLAEEGVFERL